MIKAIVIIIFFSALLLIIAAVSGKKTKSLIMLLFKGSKLEFTTKPGWVSLATVFVAAGIASMLILVTEVKQIIFHVFDIPQKETDYIAMSLFLVFATIVVNFILIALMKPNEPQNKS